MIPNSVTVVCVLLPICRHIGSGKPNLRVFVGNIVALLGEMTDEWVRKLVCGQNSKVSNDQVKFATKI